MMASCTQNRTDTKWPSEKIDLQIPSLRSQPSEGSAQTDATWTLLERSYRSAKVNDVRPRYKLTQIIEDKQGNLLSIDEPN